MPPSPADPHPRDRITVLDTEMSYVSVGEGDPIVFLHGNPTSSYLWRNIIPYGRSAGRCLAPDLVGMGRSGPSPDRAYRFIDHARYLDAWFDALDIRQDVTLILHDWGSALGFHWARRHPHRVRAIAYMESIVLPRRWQDLPSERVQIFKDLRSNLGEHMVLDENFFVEKLLPRLVLRPLSEAEMDAYRRPFPDREFAPADAGMAQGTAYRRRTRRRCSDCRGLRPLDGHQFRPQALHQRRARFPIDRALARLLPRLAKSARGFRQGNPLHSGRHPD